MLAHLTRHFYVERVPYALIVSLGQSRKLPKYPARLAALERIDLGRELTFEEGAALTWYVARNLRDLTIVGLLCYRDVLNYATMYDGREVIGVAGTPRAIVELVRWVMADARKVGRRCFCATNLGNHAMQKLFERVGGLATRLVFEDLR